MRTLALACVGWGGLLMGCGGGGGGDDNESFDPARTIAFAARYRAASVSLLALVVAELGLYTARPRRLPYHE